MGKTPKQKRAKETVLAKQQGQILKQREAAWQSFYRPILDESIVATNTQGAATPGLESARMDVNRSFMDAKRKLGQSLSERGVSGGFEGSALAGLHVAEANATADAVSRAKLDQDNRQSQLLQLARSAAPTPTSAAPYV